MKLVWGELLYIYFNTRMWILARVWHLDNSRMRLKGVVRTTQGNRWCIPSHRSSRPGNQPIVVTWKSPLIFDPANLNTPVGSIKRIIFLQYLPMAMGLVCSLVSTLRRRSSKTMPEFTWLTIRARCYDLIWWIVANRCIRSVYKYNFKVSVWCFSQPDNQPQFAGTWSGRVSEYYSCGRSQKTDFSLTPLYVQSVCGAGRRSI